ncbi:uncharacterized protein [Haliotis asinina]|uniref:uncharacterized protein n=1 Tax=Haliotis asinina TaxID=109174 RepID=UPI003531F8C5
MRREKLRGKKKVNIRKLLAALLMSGLISVFVMLNYAQHSIHFRELAQSLSLVKSAREFLQRFYAHHHARTNSGSQTGFQRVGDAFNTYVYSATYDDVDVPIIRIITLVRYFRDAKRLPSFVCTYFNASGQASPVTFTGLLEYIPEGKWGYRYHSGFIKCMLPKDVRPTTVSISGNITAAHNMLRVIYPLKKKRRLTRCFSALHSNFSNTLQLIQTLEISLMFGVDHFIVYNHSIHESAMNVLKHYRNLGVLDILPWDVPVNRTQIHYFAQLAAIHDCLYRNLHVSDYILTGDTDEVYIPKRGGSTLEMINDILKGKPSCSGILVQHTFFPLNLQPHVGNFTLKQEARRLGITYLLYTTRLKINKPGYRSKLIIKPTGVEMSYIHNIERLRKGHTDCICPSSQCILHHYRAVPPREWGSLRQTDATLLNYSEIIVKRVTEKMDQLHLDGGTSSVF